MSTSTIAIQDAWLVTMEKTGQASFGEVRAMATELKKFREEKNAPSPVWKNCPSPSTMWNGLITMMDRMSITTAAGQARFYQLADGRQFEIGRVR